MKEFLKYFVLFILLTLNFYLMDDYLNLNKFWFTISNIIVIYTYLKLFDVFFKGRKSN